MFSSPSHPHKRLTLTAVCLGTFMLLVDLTIVVVALPSIRTALHTTFSDVQWTIDAYSLSLAALLLPTGSLADILGRRRVFAAGLAVFTVGSLLCGIAGSGTELIIFRAFQGIGGATIFATSLALLAQTFHGRERGVAFGIWGAIAGVATALGPALGGLLTTELSWRWIFFVNLPFGVVAIVITLIGVQEFRPPHARRIDVPGFAVFTLGLVALVYGLIESSRDGWSSARVIVALAIAVVSLAAFGMNGSLYAMLLYLVLYLQNGLHDSALGAGVRLVVITGGSMLTAIPAGRLSAHMPVRWLIGPGLILVGAGLLLMRGLGADTGWTHLIVGFAVAGAGSGLVNPPLASTAVGVVAPQDAGMASGVNTTLRQVGIATSVAALGSIFAAHMRSATPATLTAHYASTLNALLLVTAAIAFMAAACALVLIRPRDFHPAQAPETAPGAHGDAVSTPASASASVEGEGDLVSS